MNRNKIEQIRKLINEINAEQTNETLCLAYIVKDLDYAKLTPLEMVDYAILEDGKETMVFKNRVGNKGVVKNI